MLSLSKSVRFLPSYAPGNRRTASTNGGLIEIAGFLLWKWPGTLRWHGNSRQYSPKLRPAICSTPIGVRQRILIHLQPSILSTAQAAAMQRVENHWPSKGQITGKKKRAKPARRAATP